MFEECVSEKRKEEEVGTFDGFNVDGLGIMA